MLNQRTRTKYVALVIYIGIFCRFYITTKLLKINDMHRPFIVI